MSIIFARSKVKRKPIVRKRVSNKALYIVTVCATIRCIVMLNATLSMLCIKNLREAEPAQNIEKEPYIIA
jgi:hypothetical protein